MAKRSLLDDELLMIPVKYVVFFTTGLPFAAVIICVLLSVFIASHYQQAVQTHCDVYNWLPSVSAAVASFSPQRYIWRFLVGLHGAPSFGLALAFRNLLLSSALWPAPFRAWFRWATNLACGLHFSETISLLLLTAISSDENLFVHVSAFLIFALSAILHMLLSTWLFEFSGRRRSTKMAEISYQYKVLCTSGGVISMLLAFYLYYRHNKYCEPGMYSLFALCEYALITFCLLFHCTLFYDFHSRVLTLSSVLPSNLHQYELLSGDYNGKRT